VYDCCFQFSADMMCTQDVKKVADLPLESVVEVTGTIQLRPHGQANKARY